MTRYGTIVSPNSTPQREKARADQVKNNAGGFVFALDKWARLDRFLILGTEGGTYYANERKHTLQAVSAVSECIAEDGVRAVARIVEISDAGRAPKNDPAIFALAMCAGSKDEKTRRAALAAIPKVCRIGTHLFHFAADVEQFRRWGRSLRTAVANWYNEKQADDLALQLVKYQARDGWGHRDLLRLAHPTPATTTHRALFRYASRGAEEMEKTFEKKRDAAPVKLSELPALIQAVEEIHSDVDAKRAIELIREHRLPHECVPNEIKDNPKVWEAMLPSMGITALIRNLGKLSSLEMTKPMSATTKTIVSALTDVDKLRKGRVHPLVVLYAMKTYEQGHGLKGSLRWAPERAIVDALDDAFYASFGFVEPTGKNTLLALDVSGSMSSPMPGTAVSCRAASSAMAMVTARVEKNWHCFGFSHRFVPLPISPKMRLDDIEKKTDGLPFERTDCSIPMVHAMREKLEVDTFVVYTDNETYAGTPHPFQALREYRQKSGRAAKLVVVGMTATGFSIADPSDAGMLDVVGFDTATPGALAEFAKS